MSTSGARGGAERGRLGSRLREARERRNLSLQAVAERTKIPAPNLDAIENDQCHRLPGGIFARSFVRTYAREVGLDPEEAVREFVRLHPEHAAPDAETDDEDGTADRAGTGGPARVAAAIAVVAILSAAGFAGYRWLQTRDSGVPAAEPTPGTRPDAPPPVASSPAERAIDPSEASRAFAAESSEQVVAATGEAAEPAAAAPPVAPPASPSADAETAQTAPGRVEPLPAVDPDGIRLEIHPSAPCWVRVSVDGRVRLERLVQPGERPVVVAADGLQLQVGDAGAFDYTLNGQRGRSLGPAGSVVRVTISRDNLGEFVAR